MSNATSKENSAKGNPQSKGRKIYITKRVWYYENDPFDKEKTEAAKRLVQNLDWSEILGDNSDSERKTPPDK